MNAPTLASHLMSVAEMAPQEITVDVLAEKYAKGHETTAVEIHRRVARSLASAESEGKREAIELEMLAALDAGFVPAGRIMSAAGTGIQATLMNCFVQPVGDSMVNPDADGKTGIYTAVAEAAETMRRGGGVGYDFSRIRPNGSYVNSTQSRSSGPISFMKVFDASCETVESAGARRGAQMGVLRCDHPDIEAFISAKDTGGLKNFNISIGVTDAFVEAVIAGGDFELIHKAAPHPDLIEAGALQRADGKWVYRTVKALDLWNLVMASTYDHAEPGILYIDRMNQENNLWYCETIEATNPCAEEPLPDYGCCDLGSINLTRFVADAFTDNATFDFSGFKALIPTCIRMLDNVLDVTYWPLDKQRKESDSKRRVGLGYLGLGDALIMLGLRYDSEAGRNMAAEITRVMRDESYLASVALAAEKGSFPLLDVEKYLQSGFAKRLPEHIKEQIRTVGLRNSHLLAIAPTGTIALAFADNASNGIEPAFSWSYDRKKRLAEGGHRMYEVADHAWRLFRHMGGDVNNLPDAFVTALEMSADSHMKMLEAVQPFLDTSISKTVNVSADYPYEEFKDLYLNGWKAGLKGLATYRPNSVLGSVLSTTASTAPAPAPVVSVAPVALTATEENPLTKHVTRPAGRLSSETEKVEMWTQAGKRSIYVTVGYMPVAGVVNGRAVTIERPVEFLLLGESDQWLDGAMRLLSLAARSGASIEKALENLREIVWAKGVVRSGFLTKEDGTQIPRFHESEVAALAHALQQMLSDRGFLTPSGNQVKLSKLTESFASDSAEAVVTTVGATYADVAVKTKPSATSLHFANGTGDKCPDCGAHDMHHVDGCTKCLNCGHIGSCG